MCCVEEAGRPASSEVRNAYFKKAIKVYGINQFLTMYISFLISLKKKPVHPKLPSFLTKLKKYSSVYNLALTAMDIEKIGLLSCQVSFRLKELKQNGYVFDNAITPVQTAWYFFDFYHGRTPPYHEEGVIFSAYHNKGEVLRTALERFNIVPKKIIIVEDIKQNLIYCSNILKKSQLEIFLIHYQEKSLFDEKNCKKDVEKQFKYWLKHQY